ncbi:SIS domain-containing protein [bacterium]|nr:SIS domain-containing protein [bacterium]
MRCLIPRDATGKLAFPAKRGEQGRVESFAEHLASYRRRLHSALAGNDEAVERLARALRDAWQSGAQVFLCGNGGSAANAMHLANDLLYGVAKETGRGLRVEALPANASVLTCLANDVSYDEIFALQLAVKARAGDVLVILSGSGNSKNVVRALEVGNALGMKTFAVLGYSGGRCKELAQVPIHFAIDDMQVSEDLQLVVGHVCAQWLRRNPPEAA